MSFSNGDWPRTDLANSINTAKMGKRSFLSALTGLGFSSSTLSFLNPSDIDSAASDQAPIVLGFSRDNSNNYSAVKKNVPADWYNDILAARRVKEKLAKEWSEVPGVNAISVNGAKFGGRGSKVELHISERERERLLGHVPESRNGVPIDVIGSDPVSPDSCSTSNLNSDYGSSIPGGVVCGASSGDEESGSLMPEVIGDTDSGSAGSSYFLTALHLFGDTNIHGDPLWHPDSNHVKIGDVVKTHCYDDLVLVDPKYHSPEQKIAEEPAPDVTGHFAKDGAAAHSASDDLVYKMGATSCLTYGHLWNHDVLVTGGYGCLPRDHNLHWGESTDSQGGDSGGPIYTHSPETTSEEWIMGVNQFSNSSGNYAGGMSAYAIHNSHGYIFG